MSLETRTAAAGSRPRLPDTLPLLRVGDGRLRIGVDPRRGLQLDGVPTALDPVLARLDGDHRLDALRAETRRRGVEVAVFDQVVTRLDQAGLLAWEPQTPPTPQTPQTRSATPVRLVGAGRTGRAVAERLLAAAIGPLELSDSRPVDRELYPEAPLAGCLADALADHLRRHGPAVDGDDAGDRHRDADWADNGADDWADDGTLTVVAVDTWESDRRLTDALLRADRPHLVIRPWLGGVAVGPLVVPGRSPCLNCLDAARTARDPDWPELLGQLVRRPGVAAPDLLILAAGLVVTQVCGWRSDRRAELISNVALIVPPERHLRTERWTRHPDCGCAWPVTAR